MIEEAGVREGPAKVEVLPEGNDTAEGSLRRQGRRLAGTHETERGRRPLPLASLEAVDQLEEYFGDVQTYFTSMPKASPEAAERSKAAEWFLDNGYLTLRALRQVRADLPPGFYRRLPVLCSGPFRGLPRVYALARSLAAACDFLPNLESIVRFVDGYQEVRRLDISELWALPTMLRIASVEELAQSLVAFVPEVSPRFATPFVARYEHHLDHTEAIARTIQSFRALAYTNWRTFFQRTSTVERILARDPSGVYPRMDFETRDRYRKVVEEIARGTGLDEGDVAERPVALAEENLGDLDGATDPVAARLRTHVGHFLLGAGRRTLERSLGYRPPFLERLGRAWRDRPTTSYLGAIAVLTLVVWAIPLVYLSYLATGSMTSTWGAAWPILLCAALALVPASAVAITLVQWALTNIIPPSVLAKMNFERGIPAEHRTLVVIPTLLGSLDQVDSLLRQIELHYLSNPDPTLRFALLTDHLDAPRESMPGDSILEERAAEGIRGLNEKYAAHGLAPFHLLHRARHFNPSEGCWMGWERKRGKLEELNELLLGREDTSFTLHVGERGNLDDLRFVITLDTDTQLPRGGAARLVSILAHPLNHAEFDPRTGGVTSGYTIVQPRVEISPGSSNGSYFMRVFSGDVNLDIYTRAVSDVYQDLFGSGLYIGKGIYDLHAFRRSLEGRAPQNALVSHDLFEGIHGRVALATDIVLYEEYPPHYLAFVHRMHRWIRGDWQLLPWLGRRVPAADGRSLPNRFSTIDRWKVFDNMRRSLFTPALLLFLLAGWLVLPGHPLVWTLLAICAPGAHIFAGILSGLAKVRRRGRFRPGLREIGKGVRENSGRWALSLAFLPHEAAVITDAIVRTLGRLRITRRHFLEWRTAAHTARLFAGRPRLRTWKEMWIAVVLAVSLAILIPLVHPQVLPYAIPFLVAWLLAPELALRISEPPLRETEDVGREGRLLLRDLARKTWLFYETFVGAEDQWLPPDNYQEEFKREVAHRTSPTNIGMYLLSTLAARDLGYLTLTEMTFRLQRTLDTLDEMERYRGHLLNWYDTRTLEPLLPRYVSTVDSGNLAGAMITLRQGCLAAVEGPVLRDELWNGLLDDICLLEQTLATIQRGGNPTAWRRLEREITRMRAAVCVAREAGMDGWRSLPGLADENCARIHAELLAGLEQTEGAPDLDSLRSLKIWTNGVQQAIATMRTQVRLFLPWIDLVESPPLAVVAHAKEHGTDSPWPRLARLLGQVPRLAGMEDVRRRARALLATLTVGDAGPQTTEWAEALRQALDAAVTNATALRNELDAIATRARDEVQGTDFTLLYDKKVHLFHIGFNCTANKHDPNHYDLLASEARLASFVAIAKADVPLKHWFHLGRTATRFGKERVLLSWGATMFEYLMPDLLMTAGEDTLIGRSCAVAVDAQVAYGDKLDVPWGISESGYYHFDADRNYQYQAFGVPGLGFRRGLAEDLVIAPYASVLALPHRPRAVLRNLQRFVEMDMVGPYGLYEAVDFTAARVPQGRDYCPVRSYMAHHQGMILLSLDNHLHGNVMNQRFGADPTMRSVCQLLFEQIPSALPTETPHGDERDAPAESEAERPALPSWHYESIARSPMLHVLSNGTLSTGITDSGGGFTRWRDYAVTGWAADPTRDADGTWIYISDADTGDLWSVGRNPIGTAAAEYRVTYRASSAEFSRREHGIFLRMELSIAPSDDVEIRLISVTNESDRPRRLAITSFAEVILASEAEHRRHPAFSKLFVQSEYLGDLDALLFARRPRSSVEKTPVLVHRLLVEDETVRLRAFETDRECFLGRNRSTADPAALAHGGGLRGTTGTVLDPVMALQAGLKLPPHGTVTLGFATIVAGSRRSALELTTRYGSLSALEWSLRDAEVEASREVQRTGIDPAMLPILQRLHASIVVPPPFPRHGGVAGTSYGFTQARLWGFGISGDHPILLVRALDNPGTNETGVLTHVLLAHRFWRRRGQRMDVVVLRQGVSGYDDDTHGSLRRILERTGAREWLNRPGGVFVIRADQVTPEDRLFLEAMANTVLDTGAGSIAEQLGDRVFPSPELPPFVPPGGSHPEGAAPEPAPPLARPTDLLFDNGIGGFRPDGREYVIHLEEGETTPAPWSNVLANAAFGSLVTESGIGNTWALNSGENRLTPWANDPVCNPSGEAIYLRDEETAHVWSPTPLPAPGPGAHQVRHGAGYTDYTYHGEGLEQNLRVFVPSAEPVKLLRLRLRNLHDRPRRLTATFYVEWVLGSDPRRTRNHVRPSYHGETGAVLATCDWNADFAGRTAFIASSEESHGATADRTEFLGRNGSMERPAALGRWGLCGTFHSGVDPCGALQVHVELPPGGEKELHFVLGQGTTRADALDLVRVFRNPAAVDEAWHNLGQFWDGILDRIQVETPEPALDLMLNRWLLYETVSCRLLGRTALYQSSGAFGFRDQLQDVMALAFCAPEMMRSHILRAARQQFEDGDVLHWWHPPANAGVRTRCSDDLLWLPYVVAEYVDVTGDESILHEKVPFLRAEPLTDDEHDRYGHFSEAPEPATILVHCRRAIERGATRGSRGLPLMGSHDWNDGMSEVGVKGTGESVWLAWFVLATQHRFADLCERVGEVGEAVHWRQRAEELRACIEAAAWEDDRYLRAWYDDGTPLGSARSEEGRIFSLPQAWAALSGGGDPVRTRAAIATAVRELVDENHRLVRLFDPPFDHTDHEPGYIKGYPPGLRENGGQYTHAATWLAWAARAVGDVETCCRLVRILNPVLHADNAARARHYRVEPYVIAADVYGVAPHTGRGGWTWYTGAAAWAWRLGIEGVLGVSMRDGRLHLDPAIPAGWEGYSVRIRLPHLDLTVRVRNSGRTSDGRPELFLDGRAVEAGDIPLATLHGSHELEVRVTREPAPVE